MESLGSTMEISLHGGLLNCPWTFMAKHSRIRGNRAALNKKSERIPGTQEAIKGMVTPGKSYVRGALMFIMRYSVILIILI